MGYRSANKTVYSAKYHIMWRPKYRRRVLVGRIEARWSPSWLVSTVGGAPLEVVGRYVDNQELAA
ncbi:MAG: transposase [Acidimicrobiales bacterium]